MCLKGIIPSHTILALLYFYLNDAYQGKNERSSLIFFYVFIISKQDFFFFFFIEVKIGDSFVFSSVQM